LFESAEEIKASYRDGFHTFDLITPDYLLTVRSDKFGTVIETTRTDLDDRAIFDEISQLLIRRKSRIAEISAVGTVCFSYALAALTVIGKFTNSYAITLASALCLGPVVFGWLWRWFIWNNRVIVRSIDSPAVPKRATWQEVAALVLGALSIVATIIVAALS